MMDSRGFLPVDWEQIPDLGLYMDQVVTYVSNVLLPLQGGAQKEILTASMVNNYVKQGLLPRPQGKKYTREHLALILMIAFLKRTMAMDEIKKLFDVMGSDIRQSYESFAACQNACIKTEHTQQRDAQQVMQQAIFVAMAHIDCLDALENLHQSIVPTEEKKPSDKKERRRKQND